LARAWAEGDGRGDGSEHRANPSLTEMPVGF